MATIPIGKTYPEKPAGLKDGLLVIGTRGEAVGRVKEIHAHDFALDRASKIDVHVPFSAIQQVANERAMLNVRGDQIDDQHWAHI